jgi:hypothetical protein
VYGVARCEKGADRTGPEEDECEEDEPILKPQVLREQITQAFLISNN